MEHLTQKQIEDFCRRQLSSSELLSTSDHLGECEACRRELSRRMDGDAAFFELRSNVFEDSDARNQHLTTEQMANYVDRSVSGEELQITLDHLNTCEQCAIEVDDLRTFRNDVAPSLDRDLQPLSSQPSKAKWWRRTIASVPALFRLSPAPVSAAALGILFLAFTGWLILRTAREPNQEVVVAPSPSPRPSVSSIPPAMPQPEAPSVVATLNDGGAELTLDKEGKLTGADQLPVAYRNLIKNTLTTGRVEKSSQLNGLARPASSLMGADKQKERFSVLGPVAAVVISDQPTFHWLPLKGTASYVVEIYDDKFKLVATSLQITGHSWRVPQSLERGSTYSWQVKANRDGEEITSPRPPAPQAKFRILDQAKVNELARAKRAYGSSHLTLGLLYAEAGLLKDSEQELRMLLKANPNSELARSLLRQVQAWGR